MYTNQMTVETALLEIKDRFVSERVNGYVDRSGVRHKPVTSTEATAAWTLVAPEIAKTLETDDGLRRAF